MTGAKPESAIEAIFRIEQANLIAHLFRLVRDLGTAEELAQDALVAALERWPSSGVPENPGAWLMAVARHRALDRLRRERAFAKARAGQLQAGEPGPETREPDFAAALDDQIGDDLLRLIFIACHPILSPEARVALTLRLVGGLSTSEIARAFLQTEPTIAQRIVRAKRTLAEAQIPFEAPRGEELSARISTVLEVIYLIFNEGYSASAGEDWMRPALCADAIRLGRILAQLAPEISEAHGLIALLELQASRLHARLSPTGEPILLLEQDRGRWDALLIQRGLAALDRARALAKDGTLESYALQASIAACHARARTADATDWKQIAALYTELGQAAPSPIVELNRAIAISMAFGARAGLPLLDALSAQPGLQRYPFLYAARADLLAKLGRSSEARIEFERAAALTENARQKLQLLARAEACGR